MTQNAIMCDLVYLKGKIRYYSTVKNVPRAQIDKRSKDVL